MQKHHILTISLLALGLVACQRQGVEVVKVAQDSTVISQQQKAVQAPAIQANIPANVTAVCRDGSYSTAKDETACSGNGGVASFISRHHSE